MSRTLKLGKIKSNKVIYVCVKSEHECLKRVKIPFPLIHPIINKTRTNHWPKANKGLNTSTLLIKICLILKMHLCADPDASKSKTGKHGNLTYFPGIFYRTNCS